MHLQASGKEPELAAGEGRKRWDLWDAAPVLGADVAGMAVNPLALRHGEIVPKTGLGGHWVLVAWVNLRSVVWTSGKVGGAQLVVGDSLTGHVPAPALEQALGALRTLLAGEAAATHGLPMEVALQIANAIPCTQVRVNQSLSTE
jgi:hypothetical protein